MRCPKCTSIEDKVIDSRIARDGNTIRRRRECLECGHRFTTNEEFVRDTLVVVTDETPGLLVREPLGHRVPPVHREGRCSESTTLDCHPFFNVGRPNGLHAQRATLDRLREVSVKRRPGLVRQPPASV